MAHQLWHYLRDSVARHPERPAVAGRTMTITYRELDEWSDRVAERFTAAGVGPGDRVGLYLSKSPLSVVFMLGVTKAGAAYVPADPNQPARRAGFIFDDCAVNGIVTTSAKAKALREAVTHVPALLLLVDDEPDLAMAEGLGRTLVGWPEVRDAVADHRPRPNGVEQDPAYLLYTSGSTGNPKGVIISHRNAMAFTDWAHDMFHVTHADRLSNHAPHHFDLSVLDIYVALKAGACVSMVPDEVTAFPVELARWIADDGITVWYSVPSALIRLLLHGDLTQFRYPKLHTVLFAGEVFPVKYLRQIMETLPSARFHNLYGPTETNVCTCYSLPERLADDVQDISIGAACANTEVFAVKDDGTVAAAGETGELFVRGPTVMLGYWGLEERTRASLVRNPIQPAYEERVYRTGDLVRLEADGNYTFQGRRDHMIKSRGYRIELGEIEQALYADERIREAVVVAMPDDEVGARLSAVVVLHDGAEASKSQLTGVCRKRLPRYMVPEAVHVRTELPHTSTGKIDRQAVLKSLESEAAATS
ncbi:MAG TPA: amino acid adenylation domain-containing protein [Gemmatimonadales bacterium]